MVRCLLLHRPMLQVPKLRCTFRRITLILGIWMPYEGKQTFGCPWSLTVGAIPVLTSVSFHIVQPAVFVEEMVTFQPVHGLPGSKLRKANGTSVLYTVIL